MDDRSHCDVDRNNHPSCCIPRPDWGNVTALLRRRRGQCCFSSPFNSLLSTSRRTSTFHQTLATNDIEEHCFPPSTVILVILRISSARIRLDGVSNLPKQHLLMPAPWESACCRLISPIRALSESYLLSSLRPSISHVRRNQHLSHWSYRFVRFLDCKKVLTQGLNIIYRLCRRRSSRASAEAPRLLALPHHGHRALYREGR